MRELGMEISGGPARHVSDAIPLGPGLVLQGTRMRFKRNEEIFGEGEAADYVYRVVTGAVRTIRFSSDGRRQILSFHLPGDVFGLEPGALHSLSAEAVCDAEVALIRRSLIDTAAAQDTAAANALLGLMRRELQNAQEHALVLGRKGAGERVAAFLLQLSERVTAEREIDLPMSRADIADYLALTIETVSRAFTQMERDCAIALPSSRHVVVRDRGALQLLEAA
ncbi:MAG TPA: helix-turn-helix domain-containing protein [Vitreimonas sp.]|uniref:helix-turn-helix domain-containing protein n=1 Tax=Vitreimonas sp. TaxID=3069702 RepID=UPI002D42DF7C|nr:helix-turn-helix domain-containing protein [Vitreimonas sp.]HYD88126.1 helix-turn-helix domain-containing protein [Vitreimonas sp.]